MRTSCYGYVKKGECSVLKSMVCRRKNCSFFKTKYQAFVDEQKAIERLSQMPEKKQIMIANKYYNGKIGWKIGGKQDD